MRIAPALLAFGVLLAAVPARADDAPALVSVCFVPGQDCEAKIVGEIDAAKHEIHLQAYSFTSTPILHALRTAIGRGMKVEAILDRTNTGKRYASAEYLRLAGADVWIDDQVAIAHNKVIVIDDGFVIGGSFNYTKAANTRNAENVTFIDSNDIAAAYLANWKSRRDASAPHFGDVPPEPMAAIRWPDRLMRE